MNDYEFGNFIMNMRIGHGFSQFQLGKLMGVSDKAVSKWETGKSKPRLNTCRRLAEVFGISLEDLLEMNGQPKPDDLSARKEALWKKARAKIYEVYGDKPPISFLARLESEKIAIKQTDVILRLDFVSQVAEAAREDHSLIIPRTWVSNFFAAWLLGATYANPLPPFSHCPQCHRTVLHPEAKDGWDLPQQKCACGAWMVNDGHNLPFDVFAHKDKKELHYDIDLNIPPAMTEKTEAMIRDYFQDICDPVPIVVDFPSYDASSWDEFKTYLLVPPTASGPAGDRSKPIHVSDAEYMRIYWNYSKIHLLTSPVLGKTIDLQKNSYNSLLPILQKPELLRRKWDSWKQPYLGQEEDEFLAEQKKVYQGILDKSQNDRVSFTDLCQMQGMVHGSGIWQDNGEHLLESGTAKLEDLAAFREDVWNYVLGKMTPANSSGIGFPFKVMENVRKGLYTKKGMDEETRRILLELGIPEWYIEHICKIQYQFPKGHSAAYIITDLILLSECPDSSRSKSV